jgi:hypothetical protein
MRYNNIKLNEKLGNLAQLKLGKLGNLIKQDNSGRYGTPNMGNRFTGTPEELPGNKSEIIDIGVIKSGITNIKKAYIKHNGDEGSNVAGFAVYIDNKAVIFGLYTAPELKERYGKGRVAYDFTAFQDQIDAMHEVDKDNAETDRAAKAAKGKKVPYLPPYKQNATSIRDIPKYQSDDKIGPVANQQLVGQADSVEDMARIVARANVYAKGIGSQMSLKLVMIDKVGGEKRQQRRMTREIAKQGVEALAARLAKYKNSKMPNAKNVHEFIDMVMKRVGNKIRFDGKTYDAIPEKNDSNQTSGNNLMSGDPFVVSYKESDKEGFMSYSMRISFRIVQSTMSVVPWKVEYIDEKSTTQIIPIDNQYWAKQTLGVETLDKTEVIRNMLTTIKTARGSVELRRITAVIKILRKEGMDWPELAMIEKSVDGELAKEAK